MRGTGLIDSPTGHGPHAHVGWVFDGPLEFAGVAAAFLDEGAARGEKLVYVADGPASSLVADVAALPGRDRLLRTGELVVLALDDAAAPGRLLPPEQRDAVLREIVDTALDAGSTGVRLAIDITSLAPDAGSLAAQARADRLADRLVQERPLSMLCGIDRSELGSNATARLACLHPLVRAPAELVPFRVFAHDGGVAITGEADGLSADILALALAATPPGPGRITVDVSRLEFIDGHALATLGQYARLVSERGGSVVLVGAPPLVRRVADLLDLEERLTFE